MFSYKVHHSLLALRNTRHPTWTGFIPRWVLEHLVHLLFARSPTQYALKAATTRHEKGGGREVWRGERPCHEAFPVFPQEGPRVGGSGVTLGHGIARWDIGKDSSLCATWNTSGCEGPVCTGRKRTEETAARPSAKSIKSEDCNINKVARVGKLGSSPNAANKIAVWPWVMLCDLGCDLTLACLFPLL